jgi:uncharacterized protein YbbC (DUF1343 family)
MAKNPKHQDQTCFGIDLSQKKPEKKINLDYLISFYKIYDGEDFFNNYFNTLAGNSNLRKAIEEGHTEEEIRQSWKSGLDQFKQNRKKYLLYPDFE